MIPAELKNRYDKCVKKVMANGGKEESDAQSICELSLTSMKPAPTGKDKEEPYAVIASADKEKHFVFSSSSKINASAEGTTIKDIEIFKAGTFKGIEFKASALDKMVANFYVLKSFSIFPHVPVRADHAGWLGEVGVIDRVGGYVKDLRVVGKTLVADIRVTSESMLEKIKEGSYINRSAEIGNYRDNSGDTYGPVLWGFAWVDIPAVEGLSPNFSFSKDDKVELINLNDVDMPKNKVELSAEEVAPTLEDIKEGDVQLDAEEVNEVAEVVEAIVEEVKEEEKKEEVKEEQVTLAKETDITGFAKDFPNEYAELSKLRETVLETKIENWLSSGKVMPATKEAEVAFIKTLSKDQMESYEALKNAMPALVKLNAETLENEDTQEKPETVIDKTPEEKADEILASVK
jgi:hypothetical protein